MRGSWRVSGISLLRSRPFSAAPCAAKPWATPDVHLSPKNLSAEDARFVLREVRAFGGHTGIENAAMPPSSWYLSEAFQRAEAQAVFGTTWQFACRADQVAQPGQFAASYVGSGEPVLVVRGDDGELRAFANVCRHHAARVAEGCGTAKEFVCPYHAWTYNLRGNLVKFTRMRGVKEFDATENHLPHLQVEQWGPLVFVRSAAGTVGGSVAQQLAPVVADFDSMDSGSGAPKWSDGGWKQLSFLRRRVYDIHCNWKVYCDNYLDGGYHIPHLHLGLNAELEMKSYKTVLHEYASVQKCKSRSARVGSDAVYAFLFPNIAINRYGDWLDTNYVVPVAPDRCVIVFDWYNTAASTPAGREQLLGELDASRAIQDEDVLISESVQCGISSQSYDKGRYSPTVEIAEYHFHRLLRDALERELSSKVQ